MAENDRFAIVPANVGEKFFGLRVKDEGGKRLMAKEPLIDDIWGKKQSTNSMISILRYGTIYVKDATRFTRGTDLATCPVSGPTS